MELFLPGLIVFILAAFFVFLIMPRIGPVVLAIASLLALVAAGIHHYNFFSSEYTLSTWQYGLASYAPFAVLGLAILFIIAALFFVFGGSEARNSVLSAVATPMEAIQEAVTNSANTMPAANTATNPVTAAINSGLNAIGVKGNNGATNVPKPANNRGNQGLGGIFSPPIPGTNIRPSQI